MWSDLLACAVSALALAVAKALLYRLADRLFVRTRPPRVYRVEVGRYVLTVSLHRKETEP